MYCELGAGYSQVLDPEEPGIGGLIAAKPIYSDTDAARQVADWDHGTHDVLDARKWGPAALGTGAVVTYGYDATPTNPIGELVLIDGDAPPPLLPLTDQEIDMVEAWIPLIEDIANIDLVRVGEDYERIEDGADFMIRKRDASYGNTPPRYDARPGADELQPAPVTLADGFSQRHTLHEILHGLGLNHPGAYDLNDDDESPLTYNARAHYQQDSKQYSIMSYFSESWTGADFDGSSGSATLMLHDVMALQLLYGANETAFEGATIYGQNSNTGRDVWDVQSSLDPMIGAIWDTGGRDILSLAIYSDDQWIDLRQGWYSSVGGLEDNLAISYGTVIEDATSGTGHDRMIGNYTSNTLRGGWGNDTISGNGGADFLFGDGGNDWIEGGAGLDSMYGGAGWDTVSYEWAVNNLEIDMRAGRSRIEGVTGFEVAEDFERVISGRGDDVIAGTDEDDVIFGGGGDDRLIGRSGDDTLHGDDGADEIEGDNGNDRLIGWAGPDTIDGGAGNDVLIGGDGNDRLIGGLGHDDMYGSDGIDWVDYRYSTQGWQVNLTTNRAEVIATSGGGGIGFPVEGTSYETVSRIENIDGSDQDDRLYGDGGVNVIRGQGGDDRISGYGGADELYGNAGDDILRGGGGADILRGGSGNDVLNGGNGTDRYYGGTGRDALDVSGHAAPYSIDLAAGQAVTYRTVELLDSIEDVYGTDGSDTILGDGGNNRISGRGGDDRIGGRGGNDRLNGGTGDDYISGGFGNDRISGGSGTDEMHGGGGVDMVDYSYSSGSWTIDLKDETATRSGGGSEIITSFEEVYGATGDDYILGTNGANRLYGNDGDDVIGGRNGDDMIFGGDGDDDLRGGYGDDLISGGRGIDTMNGGAGFDTVDYSGSARDWEIDLSTETAESDNGMVESIVNFEAVLGSRGNDLITGSDGDNRLEGRRGNDFIYGGDGNDEIIGGSGWNWLYGEFGNDTLIGGSDQDHLYGGPGADILIGGDGPDIFVWTSVVESRSDTGVDVLQGRDGAAAFTRGEDKLDLSMVDGSTLSPGNDPITFGGIGPGRLELFDLGNATYIALHRDNDRSADMVIVIADGDDVSAADYTADDFIL